MTVSLRMIDSPRAGFFRLRKAASGPWVPARIAWSQPLDPDTGEVLDRPYIWTAYIDGELVADPNRDPQLAGVFEVWTWGREITETEYRMMMKAVFERQRT